jgi:predicted membrane-bound spermidine synthase
MRKHLEEEDMLRAWASLVAAYVAAGWLGALAGHSLAGLIITVLLAVPCTLVFLRSVVPRARKKRHRLRTNTIAAFASGITLGVTLMAAAAGPALHACIGP